MSEREYPQPALMRLRTLSHHITFALGKRFPRTISLVFVLGYPKSGTTWACQLAADYLQLPFPRHSLLPVGYAAVVHGHETVSRRFQRGLYVMRDGRDALTSLYFFIARRLPAGDNPILTRHQRRLFPNLRNRDDVAANIGPFIERQMRRPHPSPVHWGAHVRSYYEAAGHHMVLLRYEDLRCDPEGALAEAMARLEGAPPDSERVRMTIAKFSFERQAGRKPGVEDRASFLRKGEVGDWRNHFTREAADIFDRYCGEALVQAGYESDRTWVDRFSKDAAAQPSPGEAVTPA